MTSSNDPTVHAAGHHARMCKVDASGEVGLLLYIRAEFGDATANITVFNNSPFRLRIIDVFIENQQTNGVNVNSLGVYAGTGTTNPLTDVMVLNNIPADEQVYCLTLDDDYCTVLRGGTLYLNVIKAGGTMGGVVWMRCLAQSE